MQKHAVRLLFAMSLILLAGCQYFQFPGVYRIDIQQGNIITQDMIDQLKPGMTRRQVRYVMGNPMIEDTFNPDRWDYFYTLTPAKGETTKEHLTIYFDGDVMTHFNGDFVPGSASTRSAAAESVN